MNRLSQNKKNEIKQHLLYSLKEENAFWSYKAESVSLNTIDDDTLIAFTMRYLDLGHIKSLFSIYPFKRVKDVWKNILVPEGEYLYSLNRFFAWYYFKAKNPDTYLKNLQTRHLKSLLNL